jgi:hypothetical protein
MEHTVMPERQRLQTIEITTPAGLKTRLRVAPDKAARYQGGSGGGPAAAQKRRGRPKAKSHQPRARAQAQEAEAAQAGEEAGTQL